MLSQHLGDRMEMRAAIATVLYGAVVLASPGASTNNFDVLDYVNPLIGTSNGGESFKQKSHLQGWKLRKSSRPCICRCYIAVR